MFFFFNLKWFTHINFFFFHNISSIHKPYAYLISTFSSLKTMTAELVHYSGIIWLYCNCIIHIILAYHVIFKGYWNVQFRIHYIDVFIFKHCHTLDWKDISFCTWCRQKGFLWKENNFISSKVIIFSVMRNNTLFLHLASLMRFLN